MNNKYYLGRICKHEHQYKQSGQSLRYKSTRQCVECLKLIEKETRIKYAAARKDWVQRNKQHVAKLANIRYWKAPEKFRAANQRHLDTKKSDAVFLEKKRESQRRTYQKNAQCPEFKLKEKERGKKYRKENPDVGRVAVLRRRARLRTQQIYYTAQMLKERRDIFGECAYCGGPEYTHADHFIPISKGGIDCIENIIPACQHCNLSKNCKDPIEWFRKQKFFTEERLHKILNALNSETKNILKLDSILSQ